MSEPDELLETRRILNKWRRGEIDEQQIHMLTERMFEDLQDRIRRPPEDNHMSILYEVLSQLSILNYQLITSDDIPAFLRFLETPEGKEGEGWYEWRKYWENIDFRRRRKVLADNSYYSTDPFPHES